MTQQQTFACSYRLNNNDQIQHANPCVDTGQMCFTVPAAPQHKRWKYTALANFWDPTYPRRLTRTTKFGMMTRRPSEGRVLGVSHDPSQSWGPNRCQISYVYVDTVWHRTTKLSMVIHLSLCFFRESATLPTQRVWPKRSWMFWGLRTYTAHCMTQSKQILQDDQTSVG